ncbi:MAG: DUF2956 family protein [Pseudomonadota bacterium]
MSKQKPRKSHASQQRERQLADAMAIAKGIQQDGQSKEQTRAVARGIAKGIALYKKQQKARARQQERDRRRREAEFRRDSEAALLANSSAAERAAPGSAGRVALLLSALLMVGAVAAIAADMVAARRVGNQLAAATTLSADAIDALLPDSTPTARLRRGVLVDALVSCRDGRLRHEFAGLSVGRRLVLHNPDLMQACRTAARD